MKGQTPTTVQKQHFSKPWFLDAVKEAQVERDKDARRREILFSVCFAECYLVEWVRDEILAGRIEEFTNYFPPDRTRNVREKWKDVPKELRANNEIVGVPELNAAFWSDFCYLVDLRDGLVHAHASRPSLSNQDKDERPMPDLDELSKMEAGWPTKVVVALVKCFHLYAKKPIPDWLQLP